jgi:prolyl-tRNA synthetase
MAMPVAATGANAADTHLVGVVPGRDFQPAIVADINLAAPGDPCPLCDRPMEERRGIEVGHIFKLGTKYSEPMHCTFLDAGGEEKPCIMGCYGLGVGRTIAAAVEQSNDERGIVWPLPLAPYEVVLVLLNADKEEVVSVADELYGKLEAAGVEVLYDDRPERPGVKFNDMDLIGFPVRVVVGKKGLGDGNVEISLRRDRERRMTPVSETVQAVIALLDELRSELAS